MNMIILFAIATFVSTLFGGLLAIRFRKYLPYFFAFSAGTLIAVSFLDLLPESIEVANNVNFPVKYLMLIAVLSFLFYSLLEKYFLAHNSDDKDDDHGHIFGPIGAGSLILHSFLDGVAIGASYQINSAVGLVVALAVISHDFTDGINTVTLMLKNKHKTKSALFFLIMDSIAPILGVLAASLISLSNSLLACILAFFVGEFLYIGAANLLPATNKHKSGLTALFLILGIALIYILTSIV